MSDTLTFNKPNDERVAEIKATVTTRTRVRPEPGYVTGSRIASGLNALLEEAGAEDRKVKPQMVYNYIRKGYIPSNEQGHVLFKDAQEWVEVQFVKRTADLSTAEIEPVDLDEDTDEVAEQ